MAMDLKRYERLKEQVDTLQQRASRAEGALEQTMRRLKEEFNCDNIKQARAKYEKMKREQEKAEREFEKSLAEFEKEWGEKLEDKT